MASYIFYKQKKKTGEMKESTITAAAKLIKAGLRDLDKMNNVYQTLINCLTIKDQKEWVPESLQLLLCHLIPSELKQVIIIIFYYFFFWIQFRSYKIIMWNHTSFSWFHSFSFNYKKLKLSTCVWQKAHINTVRHAMVCGVYFSFCKIL